jgi:hypothetical protein
MMMDIDYPRSTKQTASLPASRKHPIDQKTQKNTTPNQQRNLGEPEDVKTLQQQLCTVRLKAVRPRTRLPKRRMDPYEDAKMLILQVLKDPMDRRDRILRLEKEIASLLEHREPDSLYDRAIGLLELAVEKQEQRMKEEGWGLKSQKSGVLLNR